MLQRRRKLEARHRPFLANSEVPHKCSLAALCVPAARHLTTTIRKPTHFYTAPLIFIPQRSPPDFFLRPSLHSRHFPGRFRVQARFETPSIHSPWPTYPRSTLLALRELQWACFWGKATHSSLIRACSLIMLTVHCLDFLPRNWALMPSNVRLGHPIQNFKE
jgi:hypothetical protein